MDDIVSFDLKFYSMTSSGGIPFDHFDISLQQVHLLRYDSGDEIAFWPQRFEHAILVLDLFLYID